MSKGLKIFLIIISIFAGLILIAYIFLETKGEQIAGEKLREAVIGDDEKYCLTYERLDFDLFTLSMQLTNPVYRPCYIDSETMDFSAYSWYEVTADKIDLQGFNIQDWITKNYIIAQSVKVDNPSIRYFVSGKSVEDSSVKKKNYKSGLPYYVKIKKLKINNGKYYKYQMGEMQLLPTMKLENFGFNISGFEMDTTFKDSFNSYFQVEKWKSTADNLFLLSEDSTYYIDLFGLHIESGNAVSRVDSIQVTPTLPENELGKFLGHETDHVNVHNEGLVFTGLDVNALINKKKFMVDTLNLKSTQIRVYRNKKFTLPPNHEGMMFKSALKKIPFTTGIKVLKIHGLDVAYKELPINGRIPGKVWFDNITGKIYNLYSDTAHSDKDMIIDVQGYLMGKGLLKAYLVYPLSSPAGHFTARGSMGKMNLVHLNPALEKLAFVSIKSGMADSIRFKFKATEHHSSGKLYNYYHDLQIEILDKETLTEEGILGNIKSFLANKLIVEDDNPENGKHQVGTIYFVRDPQRSMFNYWWKSLLSGIKESIGISPRIEKVLGTNK